jgi:serine/threonine protein kinase
MTASNDPLLGMVVADRYILLERVAKGHSGVVYRAEHALLRSRVAVKLLFEELSRDEQALQHYHQDLTGVARI